MADIIYEIWMKNDVMTKFTIRSTCIIPIDIHMPFSLKTYYCILRQQMFEMSLQLTLSLPTATTTPKATTTSTITTTIHFKEEHLLRSKCLNLSYG